MAAPEVRGAAEGEAGGLPHAGCWASHCLLAEQAGAGSNQT